MRREDVTRLYAEHARRFAAGTAVSAFQRFMQSAADAFKLTPERPRTALAPLDESMNDLHPFYPSFIPSLARVNEARAEVKEQRDRLLTLVSRANE